MSKMKLFFCLILITFTGLTTLNAQCGSEGSATMTNWAYGVDMNYQTYTGGGQNYTGSEFDETGTWTTTTCSDNVTMTLNFSGTTDANTNGSAANDYKVNGKNNGTSTLTLTFDKPVAISTLNIGDVDVKGGYEDVLVFSANNGGTNVPVTLSAASGVTISGQTATGATADGGTVSVTTQPITELTIDYSNGNGAGGEQYYFLQQGFTICCPVACTAGTNAPTLTDVTNFTNNTYTIPCGSTTADLSTLSASNQPAGTSLTVHSGTPATNANKVDPATAVAPGTYHISFYDATNDCYSPTTQITVVQETNCCNAGNVAPTVE